MAATWEPKISVTDRSRGRVTVTATRTDGEDVRTVTIRAKFHKGKETFAAFKARLAVQLHAKYLVAVAKEEADKDFLGSSEASIKTALDGMEVSP